MPRPPADALPGAALVRTRHKKVQQWPRPPSGPLELRYRLPEDAGLLRAELAQAAQAWSSCCNVRFVEVAPPAPADFDVVWASEGMEGVDEDGYGWIIFALSFFPQQPREKRTLKVNPKLFQQLTPDRRSGLLTHELGHALGFAHDFFLQKEAGSEADVSAVDVTAPPGSAYQPDAASVMDYPKGSDWINEPARSLSERDKQTAAWLYGGPPGPVAPAPVRASLGAFF